MPANSSHVLIQNLRDITAQIRDPQTDAIVGTGVIVSEAPLIVTCRHVVAAATTSVTVAIGDIVTVYFAQLKSSAQSFTARVVTIAGREKNDDLVLLSLENDKPTLNKCNIAILGDGDQSVGNVFMSYGYRKLDKYHAGRASGIILGPVESPIGSGLSAEPIELKSGEIDAGMSGAAVLDTKRNLVVGIITETWYPEETGKNRDTSWATNAKILNSPPFNIPLQSQPPIFEPTVEIASEYSDLKHELRTDIMLNGAISPVREWVSRDDLVESALDDYASSKVKMSVLVGLGGQGKTSLARKWLDCILLDESLRPDGVFWWTFHNSYSVDLFFETALQFLSGQYTEVNKSSSGLPRAQIVAALSQQMRIVFVLDGLEVLQHQAGDQYGMLANHELQSFLSVFNSTVHISFCLITTRIPIFDLMMYSSCSTHNIDGLANDEGVALLKKLGLKGGRNSLGSIVDDWNGHPLSLTLYGNYIREVHAGKPIRLLQLPNDSNEEYARVAKMLDEYDSILADNEIVLLMVLSSFRNSVPLTVFDAIVSFDHEVDQVVFKLSASGIDGLQRCLDRLLGLQLLRHDGKPKWYQLHPLIRQYYSKKCQTLGLWRIANDIACEALLNAEVMATSNPSLEDLAPLIEATYHCCVSGRYDLGMKIYLDRIDLRRGYLVFQCGAYDTALELLRCFFVDGDATRESLLLIPANLVYLLHAIGVCFMTVGKLQDARMLLTRGHELSVAYSLLEQAGRIVQVRCEVNVHSGRINDCIRDADLAATYYRGTNPRLPDADSASLSWGALNADIVPRLQEICALSYKAWAHHIAGSFNESSALFDLANFKLLELNLGLFYLRDLWGIYHADHLLDVGELNRAKTITAANLEYAESLRIPEVISQCHRVLGDYEQLAHNYSIAMMHYDIAVREAAPLTHKAIQLEAVIARGRYRILHGDMTSGIVDLQQALKETQQYGYRIYEVDTRLALVVGMKTISTSDAFRSEALTVYRLSQDIGYKRAAEKARQILSN